ncbi:kinesin-like protein KIN-5A [Elaeis guineensis]|uniref:Kinesin-like protein KIN-5A n=1 Tax=Elaeis guineensis var. tenera TaxID=51953 RepID=A0A6I9R8V0_ELAGV|nr:kinesin-like protein KIN-5A [Elaeis guineensis]
MDSLQRKGSFVSMSPSHTPRSSDKYRSSDSNGNSNSKHDREKGVNIQVLVRCRPLSEDEKRMSTPVVITCNEIRREVSATQNIANKQLDKTFVFDKVFGPDSRQADLFDHAVVPIVNEVLEGYNCTVFAYGQTGTGKTYTMEGGGRKGKNGELPSDAGVIPRSVRQIFDVLEAQSAEYSMKVTFLELYNEEITDLLAPEESKFSDDKSKKPIALMEDGKGGVFVRGLEEEVVSSAGEIYKILDKGSARRRTAETLLNKQSSRSHSIFSITIHIKECTPEGEEMIKCGKLNLVDLAGSENISRSGAREGRAREAGEINKSLLTLGRVINTLVEHSGHIPYRDSKLTRLLRDSLGGKTKTCIIATISPSIHCLEETLNTLDYAHRAKHIKNKPEVNQKMMKSALIKDLYSEIDRLKQEVYAAREKNGIYIPRDRYLLEEAEKKAMTEKLERMEIDLESKERQLVEVHDLHNSQKELSIELRDKLEKTQRKLEDTEHALSDTEQRYRQAISAIKEKEYLISNLLKSEKALVGRACDLRSELEDIAADVSGLFSKIERKDKIEDANKNLVHQFHAQLTQQLDLLHRTVSDSVMQQENQLKEMEEGMQLFVSKKVEATEELRGCIGKLREMYGFGIRSLDDLAGELDENSQSTFGKLNSQVITHSSALEDCFQGIALEADELLNELQSSLFKQEEKLSAFAQQQREGFVRAVETTRSISKITTNFFLTLDVHASKINQILEESQTVHDQKLLELEKKFEDCAAIEERQLLEKVAEMLASSSARKKTLIQEAIGGLCQSNCDRTNNLLKEMDMVRDFTSSVKEQWMVYMDQTENHYLEDTAAVESGQSVLEEGLRHCLSKARISSQQWSDAKHSLQSIGKSNVASMDSLLRSGMEANQLLRAKLSSTAATALQDVDVANEGLISSIDGLLKLDHDAHGNIDSLIIPCHGELRELRSGHHHKTLEITENAGKCLEEEYLVDEPSCSTPRRRVINLPSVKSIEELRTPAFEELLKSFWEAKSDSKQINGDIKHFSGAHEIQSQAPRLPLTTIN